MVSPEGVNSRTYRSTR